MVRLGLSEVRTIGDEMAERIERERNAGGPYRDLRDLARRVAGTGKPLTAANLEALATADAFASFPVVRSTCDPSRAEPAGGALGGRGRGSGAARPTAGHGVGGSRPGAARDGRGGGDGGRRLVHRAVPGQPPGRSSPGTTWTTWARCRIGALPSLEDGQRVLVGGIVTHRQRPATAGGITFINLEDETGMLNVVCSPGLWQRFRRVARASNAMLIRGKLELVEGVTNLVAEHLSPLTLPVRAPSRDFR